MSVSTEIERLQGLKADLRTALVAWGVVEADAALAACVAAVQAIQNRGAAHGQIASLEAPYTIPVGYHNGSGSVDIASAEKAKITPGNIKSGISILGVAGSYTGEGVNLQTKQVTPTKSQQEVTADEGYDALSTVTVLAIPAAYQDVSGVTATAADVLTSKIIVTPDGKQVAGTMPDNGAVSATIDGLTTTSYTVPAGRHSGTGTVSLTDDIETALAAI